MPFAVTFGELVGVLAKYDCMPAIQKLVSDPDVKSGLHGKGELEAIDAARRIVEECDVGCDDVYNILDNSKVKGELAAEKKKRKYESEAELWAEGRALLTSEEDAAQQFKYPWTIPRRAATQKQRRAARDAYRPSSPAYSPTEPHYL